MSRAEAPSGLALGPRRIDGARPLLLELLLDGAPAVYDGPSLHAAVVRSLERLLSVRAPVEAELRPAPERTVLDYGAPSTERFSPGWPQDRQRLAQALRDAVAAFEPRLEEPAVSVEPESGRGDRLVVRFSGRLRLGAMLEPFAFLAPLDLVGARDDGR